MISAVLIVRNEAANLEACLASFRPHIDQLVIVDTGSTDGTAAIAKRRADRFEEFEWCDDFSAARNYAWGLAEEPWVFWCDGDDVVKGAENLRTQAKRADEKRGEAPAMLMALYEYHESLHQQRERLVCPASSFEWREPVHEVLHPKEPGCIIEHMSDVRIIHNSVKARDPNRNLRILRAHYDAGAKSVRSLRYLGLEYATHGDLGQSIQFHRRYIAQSEWDDEKALSCVEVSRHYCTLGDYESALDFAWQAMQAREGWFEPLFAVGRAYYFMAQRGGPDARRHWERCVHYLEIGLTMPETSTVLFVNPLDRSHEVHKFLNVALSALGHTERAMVSCSRGLEAKEDPALRQNAILTASWLARRDLSRCLEVLGGTYNPPGGDEKAAGALDIVVYVGQSWEPWTPETARERGIGGSETAVIEMTRRWAAVGHSCRVFGDCDALEGKYDGVEYIHHQKFAGTQCDVLISSRRPDVFDDGCANARLRLCWIHDIHLGPLLTHARALRVDRFLCLSGWHRENVLAAHPQIHPDQVLVTRNGIDLARFNLEDPPKRDPHKAIYSSSPDRGLEVLLKVWPQIRERVPDATLEVFYGFDTWEAMATRDPAQWERIEALKSSLSEHRDRGVTHHGRQPQDVVARAMLSAGVWAYPTWFSETSCITAMEAQAAGLYMVTSPIAALNETVGPRGVLVPGDWLTDEYQEAFVYEVCGAMLDTRYDGIEDLVDGKREGLKAYARNHFGWDTLAADWLDMFAKIEPGAMPKYVGFAG